MLKVVIFDSGWGGELVADFLMAELITVEVVRVIDWAHAPYCGKSVTEICELIEKALQRYIGEVDLIVLGGYAVSLALDYLRVKYPQQKFVGMGVNYDMICRSRNFPDQVVLLMDQLTSESELRQELRDKLPYSTLIIPDCTGWEELINHNLMTPGILRQDLGYDFVLGPGPRRRSRKLDEKVRFEDFVAQTVTPKNEDLSKDQQLVRTAIAKFAQAAKVAAQEERENTRTLEKYDWEAERRDNLRPDVILLLNTHFWEIKLELEALFGYRVRVLDFREKLLHDVCSALKLRGVHGGRAK